MNTTTTVKRISSTKRFSPEAKAFLQEISPKERRRISKYFASYAIRNWTLRDLRERGYKTRVLTEVSGLSSAQIMRILQGVKIKEERAEE